LKGQGRRVVIRLTYRCDLACPHCLVGTDLYRNSGELSFEEWARVLAELDLIGARKVLLTGGEPLLHKEVVRLVDLVSGMGIPVDLNSNLQRMSLALMKEMYQAGLTEISVSLEGPEQVHDRMHGKRGAYRRTIQAIAWAGALGIQVDASCCLTVDNVDHVDELLTLVETLPVQSFTISRLFPIGHGLQSLHRGIPQSRLTQLYHQWTQGWVQQASKPIRLVGLLNCPQPGDCERGRSLVGITPRGDVVPCVLTDDHPPGIPHPLHVGLAEAVAVLNRKLAEKEYRICTC
jgi:MoaA/NifB/PqqE/SkfB family radical SAM enzyme